jgi:hypothetical protein
MPIQKNNGCYEDNKNEFYVNIDRRLIKIEMALVNIVQAKGDYIHIKTESKIILFILQKNRR